MALYHAHIYFDLQDLQKVLKLSSSAATQSFFVYNQTYEKPIGPHPLPTLELHFKKSDYEIAVKWLKENHNAFSTLVHFETGDDVRDHSENILWLGKPQKLDFEFFELIKTRPDLKVHAD
jgi:DOPA 4,5-dioxygenase